MASESLNLCSKGAGGSQNRPGQQEVTYVHLLGAMKDVAECTLAQLPLKSLFSLGYNTALF